MPETNSSANRVKRLLFNKWTKLFYAFVVLIVIAYFVLTSSAFVTRVVLPRVSRSLNANVTVGHASVSPFSKVVLTDLKIQTSGTEPLISAKEFRVRYDARDLIHRKIHV